MGRLLAGGLLAAATALVAVAPAFGARIQGTQGPDRLLGTPKDDAVYGRAGNDRLVGRGGHDLLHGGPGRDAVVGETGNDKVAVHYDGAVDSVTCGRGRDVVTADPGDVVGADCEVVSLQLSRDPSAPRPAGDPGRARQLRVRPDGRDGVPDRPVRGRRRERDRLGDVP